MIKCGRFIVVEEILGEESTPHGMKEIINLIRIDYLPGITPAIEPDEVIVAGYIQKIKNGKNCLRILFLDFEDESIIRFSKDTREKLRGMFKFESKKESKDKINELCSFIRKKVGLTKEEINNVIQKMGTGETGLYASGIYYTSIEKDGSINIPVESHDYYNYEYKRYV